MKRKYLLLLLILAVSGFPFILGLASSKSRVDNRNELSINIATPDDSYGLGEKVPISISISNNGSKMVFLPDDSVEGIAIQISANNGTYQKYIGPGRGFTVDGLLPPTKIEPGETVKIQKSILWNYVPDVSHLSAEARNSFLKGRILSDYAFTKAGKYFVKVVLTLDEKATPGENPTSIESEPYLITIKDPVGDDLRVWNKIKDRSDIAYFIQEGEIPRSAKGLARGKLISDIEELINKFPDNSITVQLKQSLKKFRSSEKKGGFTPNAQLSH